MKAYQVFCLMIISVSITWAALSSASRKAPKDYYRLYPYQNTMVLMDSNRVVGILPYDSSKLSILIADKDNGGE